MKIITSYLIKSKIYCEKTIPKTIPKPVFKICKAPESAYLSRIAEFEYVDTYTLRRQTLYPAEVHPQIEYFLSLVLRLNSRSKVIKIIERYLIKHKKLFKFLIPKLIPKPLF